MTTIELLEILREKKIVIELSGDQIKVLGANENLTPEIILALKTHKTALIQFLHDRNGFRIIRTAEKKQYYPLTPTQYRFYLLQIKDSTSTAYNIPLEFFLGNQIDTSKIEEIFTKLFERHDTFRTIFAFHDGSPVQKILARPDFTISFGEANSPGYDQFRKIFNRPFTLNDSPPVRVAVVREDSGYYLLFNVHHIIADGIALAIVKNEFLQLFNGETLPPQRLQYSDFFKWHINLVQQYKRMVSKRFWLDMHANEIAPLTLPYDFPRPKLQSEDGGRVIFSLSDEELKKFRSFSSQNELTGYMAIVLVFSMLIYRVSGQNKFVVGMPVTGRNHPELERIAGSFLNILALRIEIDVDFALREYVKRVRKIVLNAMDNQDYSFEDLVENIVKTQDPGRNPVFDVMINMLYGEENNFKKVDTEEKEGKKEYETSRFDLTLNVLDSPNALIMSFQYNRKLFRRKTIEKFATYFKDIIAAVCTDGEKRITDIGVTGLTESLIGAANPDNLCERSKYLASFHQERLWFIDEFETGKIYDQRPAYHNMMLLFECSGLLDMKRLENAYLNVIAKHKILRSYLVREDEEIIEDFLPLDSFRIDNVVIDSGKNNDPLAALYNEMHGALQNRNENIRFFVLNSQEQYHICGIVVHHSICDRYSLKLFQQELITFYNQNREVTNPLFQNDGKVFEYEDYAEWQKKYPNTVHRSRLMSWKLKLQNGPAILDLPTTSKRDSVHVFVPATMEFTFPSIAMTKLLAYSKVSSIPVNILIMAAFKVCLHKYSNQDEIVIGVVDENRDDKLLKNIIGPLFNLIVSKSIIAGDNTFGSYLNELNESLSEAFSDKVPFDYLVSYLNPSKDMSRTALFDVLFQFEDSFEVFEMEGLSIKTRENNFGFGKYDLNLLVRKNQTGYSGFMTYNGRYYSGEIIEDIISGMLFILECFDENLTRKMIDLDIIPPAQMKKISSSWSVELEPENMKTIVDLFEDQVLKHADRIAMVDDEIHISYDELNKSANRIAGQLIDLGVSSGTIVALLYEKSVTDVISLLAICKSGGVYLPIDIKLPEIRRRYIIEDSGADIIMGSSLYAEGMPGYKYFNNDGRSSNDLKYSQELNLRCTIRPDAAAYIIYTSGSTGNPKGTIVEHRNVSQLFDSAKNVFDFTENDIWTLYHSLGFDFSVWEMYGALFFGGKIVLAQKSVSVDASLFYQLIVRECITVLNQTPSAFYNLINEVTQKEQSRNFLRYVIFGGEALKVGKLEIWHEMFPATKLINMYGITETTVHVTFKEITSDDIFADICNIGKPLPTLKICLLDKYRKVVPNSVIGEIYVGGFGLSRGYLNKVALTKGVFLENPYSSGERLYKSGDLAKRLPSGELIYLGRLDDQVKIRGFRIEMGEIQSVLAKHIRVKECFIIQGEEDGAKYLCAYVVSKGVFNENELRSYLMGLLPEYMVPSYFVNISQVPLTSNGKLDKAALPEPLKNFSQLQEHIDPRNAMEEKVVEIWAEVLGIDKDVISVRGNFFELGGHSLKVMKIVYKIRSEFKININVEDIFNNPTIEFIAQDITRKKWLTEDTNLTSRGNFSATI